MYWTISDQNLSNVSTPLLNITQSSLHNSPTSAFVPTATSSQTVPATVPASAFNTTPIMPFTMYLTNTLPSFSGKETEILTNFLTEFQIRAIGLVGHHDDYLQRAI